MVSPVDEPAPDAVGAQRKPPGAPVGAPLADLLRRSGRGDEAGLAELYDAMAARAYGLAVRVVRDPSQAEEVAQEALLEIWRTASRFDVNRGSAVSWVLAIVPPKA